VSTSSKEPKALTKVQFGMLLVLLAVCGIAALVAMGGVAGKHGQCPSETQTSRPGNASCYATYQNQSNTGIVGIAPRS
jgi:hypothetical protein